MKNILVLVHDRFNDVELVSTLSCLKRSKQFEITYFNPNTKIKNVTGSYEIVKLEVVNKVNYDDFDLMFIPGGPGAFALREDQESLSLIKNFITENKHVYAICDAPNVLFENQIIQKDEYYSAFPMYKNGFLDKKPGVNYCESYVTNTNNLITTARCADAAIALGLEIVKQNCDQKTYDAVKLSMLAE
ncbi:DJ-1/PfpI family protein [Mycoplasmopsis ciconiae]|uniref:DJ-1/PfpI family protein n=1 Tax=Mycoplasmopsis ciconiae TaxID=561067 RepID=A0ABU7MKX8_9BACT|nr:DJ-1/PfpI family protein [Mycoplasmopsis ciconiae]